MILHKLAYLKDPKRGLFVLLKIQYQEGWTELTKKQVFASIY